MKKDIIKSFLIATTIFSAGFLPPLLVALTQNRNWLYLYIVVLFIILWVGIYFEITKNHYEAVLKETIRRNKQ